MLEKLRRKEEKPEDVAKVVFNGEMFVDNPLAKEIRVYRDDNLLDVVDYSDVELEKLNDMGFFLEDHTKGEIPVFTTFNGSRMKSG